MGLWVHTLPLPDPLEQSLGAGLHCNQIDAGTTWMEGGLRGGGDGQHGGNRVISVTI